MIISDYENVKEVRITRQELYDLVWSERLCDISKKYYISEAGLIKKCQEWHIPMPNLKYWIQIKDTSKPPKQTPLPQYSGNSDIYVKLRKDYERVKESIKNQLSKIRKEIEEDSKINLKVPDRLVNPDPLIAVARDKLYKNEVYRKEQGIISHNQGHIGIYVSPPQISRALRFMDTIIKALRYRGHQFINKHGMAHVVVFGEDYEVSCKEKESRCIIKDEYGARTGFKPTGHLSLRLRESYHLKEWNEGKVPIEEQVSKILAGIEYRGRQDQQARIEREKQWAIREEKEKKAKELQKCKEKELADFNELFKVANRHEKAEVIRRYIDTFEKSLIQRNDLTYESKKFINWARKKADWYDPFIEAHDHLLDDVDRDDLKFKSQNHWPYLPHT